MFSFENLHSKQDQSEIIKIQTKQQEERELREFFAEIEEDLKAGIENAESLGLIR